MRDCLVHLLGLRASRILAALLASALMSIPGRSGTTTYTYDVHGRLETVLIPNGADTSEITYSYDAVNNKLSTVIQTDDSQAPTVPTGLDASVYSWQRIDLWWNASTDVGSAGISHYKVYRGSSVVGLPTGVTFQDQPLSGNTPYTYRVSAVDNAGNESGQSDSVSRTTPPQPDTTPPTDPSGLAAAVVTDNWINLTWTGSTDSGGSSLAGYEVFRNEALIGTSTVASFSDTGVVHSTSYSYKVRAYDGAGNRSGFSNVTSVATPDRTPPSVPTGLSGIAMTSTSIELNWADSSDTGGAGLQGYKIYRNGAYLTSTANSIFLDSGVTGGQTYTYRVSAYDAGSPPNESAQSAQVQVTTQSGWTSITDNGGVVLAAENSWYGSNTTCDSSTGITYCTTTYSKKYGNLAVVWNRLFDPFSEPACPAHPWGNSNYRQDTATCRVEANSAGYHQ